MKEGAAILKIMSVQNFAMLNIDLSYTLFGASIWVWAQKQQFNSIYCPASQEWQWRLFVNKVITDLESIDHLCINPIRRIGLIHKWSTDLR